MSFESIRLPVGGTDLQSRLAGEMLDKTYGTEGLSLSKGIINFITFQGLRRSMKVPKNQPINPGYMQRQVII